VKRSMVFLAALATLAGATYLTSQMFAQGPGGAGAAPAACKIGLINMAAVLKGYNKFSVYNNEIEKIRLEYEKKDGDLKKTQKAWQDYYVNPKTEAGKKEEAEKNLTQLAAAIEVNKKEYGNVRARKSDEQMVQMWKEVENAIQKFAPPNGFHLVMHYSEPLTDADKYSPPNIQRKLVGPGSSGGVCPLYFASSMDISLDIVNTLNGMYPATPVPMSAAPGQAGAPKGND
jgi:Skp family chaperone for outer membrane proteins